jgi:hypothetical protein
MGIGMGKSINLIVGLNLESPVGNYMHHLLQQSVILHFVFLGLV